jgi:hypothetical protein
MNWGLKTMNKTALIASILAGIVLVVLIFGLDAGTPTGYATALTQPMVVAEASVDGQTVDTTQDDASSMTPASETLAPLETAPGTVSFEDIGYAVLNSHLLMEGTANDRTTKSPIADAPVTVYCSGTKIGGTATGAAGAFSALTEGSCESGDQVWATIEYNGVTYESEHVTFIQFDDSVQSARHRTATVAPSGVPEFSTSTLAVAVIVGCLGLAFLRKE